MSFTEQADIAKPHPGKQADGEHAAQASFGRLNNAGQFIRFQIASALGAELFVGDFRPYIGAVSGLAGQSRNTFRKSWI
jgi:hypothetical protein